MVKKKKEKKIKLGVKITKEMKKIGDRPVIKLSVKLPKAWKRRMVIRLQGAGKAPSYS